MVPSSFYEDQITSSPRRIEAASSRPFPLLSFTVHCETMQHGLVPFLRLREYNILGVFSLEISCNAFSGEPPPPPPPPPLSRTACSIISSHLHANNNKLTRRLVGGMFLLFVRYASESERERESRSGHKVSSV